MDLSLIAPEKSMEYYIVLGCANSYGGRWRPMSTRAMLYRAAAILGDLGAIRRGPAAIIRRLIRKFGYKIFSGFMR